MLAYDYPLYTIHFPKYWMVEDKPKKGYSRSFEYSGRDNLLFHVAQDDYFGTLATVLSLIEETIRERKITPDTREWKLKTLRHEVDNLMFLQENYAITSKKDKKK